jgi:alkanesulfonate monooxygenase SsuD/methylene tetrahydromethanopterin reductase-like flavin-dependent oxidoreductase (luciferase family)
VQRKIRFSTQSGGQPTGDEWLTRAKRLEAIGYATLSMPDHMVGGAWSNMPALGAAAAVTTRLRLGNLVLDNDFRNPVVLAREFATLDVISNGRVEIGLGAGWFDRDYQSTGIPFDRGGVRVARLAEAVTLMKRLFTEDEVTFEGIYYRQRNQSADRRRCSSRDRRSSSRRAVRRSSSSLDARRRSSRSSRPARECGRPRWTT